ncbi:hypothetical protein PENFLA_c053G08086 [Penicillium flavigenum]|uniref:Uncharacterized protein n=1 Tax=Penicillium flavigenum TaxID=254877 RepID=A0A1V6SHE3_9EURO|nr:hypothetical protein PENFLA_c053G08086 [Penicillium flavigenum]
MNSRPTLDRIPKAFDCWMDRAVQLKVAHVHPSDPSKINSASKITEEEFISLRVVWPGRSPANTFPFPSKNQVELREKAKKFLRKFTASQRFLEQLNGKQDLSDQKLGAFALVLDSYQQITLCFPESTSDSTSVMVRRSSRNHGEPKYSSTSPLMNTMSTRSQSVGISDIMAAADGMMPYRAFTKDEQIVNDALLQFLKAVTLSIPNVKCRWSFARSPFGKVDFGENEMTARVDGYLEGIDVNDVFAITENPRESRSRRPLLISQDHYEIYLTLGTATPGYMDWLEGKIRELFPPLEGPLDPARHNRYKPNFAPLTLQEYSPFVTTKGTHMKELAIIIVCLAMQVIGDVNDAKERQRDGS